MIKVLHIMNGANAGGISSVVLNYYSRINREEFHFDCAMTDMNLGPNGLALQELGTEFFEIPLKSKHPFKFIIILYKLLKKGKYDVIHVHNNESSLLALIIATVAGIKKRVAHAHTVRRDERISVKIKLLISHIFIRMFATKMVACTTNAAISIFGKGSINSNKTIILKNSIDTKRYQYREEVREEVRRELNLKNKFVLGCVGNLLPEKNYFFAIDIVESLVKLKSNFVLIIVGSGYLESTLKDYVKSKKLEKNILFLGRRSDVDKILQAFDCFLMPSKYEGFGIAALEAATAGLPILLSSQIPNNFLFYSRNRYIEIDKGVNPWISAICNLKFDYNREAGVKEVINAGYDILYTCDDFKRIYN